MTSSYLPETAVVRAGAHPDKYKLAIKMAVRLNNIGNIISAYPIR